MPWVTGPTRRRARALRRPGTAGRRRRAASGSPMRPLSSTPRAATAGKAAPFLMLERWLVPSPCRGNTPPQTEGATRPAEAARSRHRRRCRLGGARRAERRRRRLDEATPRDGRTGLRSGAPRRTLRQRRLRGLARPRAPVRGHRRPSAVTRRAELLRTAPAGRGLRAGHTRIQKPCLSTFRHGRRHPTGRGACTTPRRHRGELITQPQRQGPTLLSLIRRTTSRRGRRRHA